MSIDWIFVNIFLEVSDEEELSDADSSDPKEIYRDLVLDIFDLDKGLVTCGAFLESYNRAVTAESCLANRIIIQIRDQPGYLKVEPGHVEDSPGIVIMNVSSLHRDSQFLNSQKSHIYQV